MGMDDVLAGNTEFGVEEEHLVPDFLNEVRELIDTTKRIEYGDTRSSFQRIAEYWSAYLSHISGKNIRLRKRDVAMMMVLFKLTRLERRYKRDSTLDLTAYSVIYDQLCQES